MRVLIVGHAYAASYNRRDKLARIARDPRVDELAVIIPARWYDRMLGLSRAYEKIPEDKLYRVYLLRVAFKGSQIRHLYSPISLYQVVRQFKPDLIQVEQEIHDWVLWEIVLLNKLFWHKPLVVFVWENLKRKFGQIVKWLNGYVVGEIDLLIGGNTEAVKIAQAYGYNGSSVVIPQFGVNEEYFKPIEVEDLKKELGLEGKFVIGFVGRYAKEKGIHTFIKALRLLARQREMAWFIAILLSSMEPPEWLIQEANPLGNQIRFVSQVPHEDFPRYMNLFDVLVLPSETQKNWKEQFGRVMIEAMACGVPVVGSSSGAIPEVIGEAGMVFQEGKPKDLANKLGELVRRPELLRQLSKRARPYVLKNYTHAQVVQKTVDQWELLLRTE